VRDVAGESDQLGATGRPGEPDFLFRVVDLLRSALQVKELLLENGTALPELAAVARGIDDLPHLREEIPAKIDPREGVRGDATPKLADLRQRVAELRTALRARAMGILSDPRLRRAFQAEGLSIKNDRYLLPVKAEYRSWVRGPARDRSQSGSTIYVEPESITYDGDLLLEALDKERDEVQRILWELTRKVLDARGPLRRVQERLEWVDFTAAKARYAAAFGLTSPVLVDDGVLELKDARHPVLLWLARDPSRDHHHIDLEAVQRQVVPITLRLGERFRVLIITGPNTGGKTVALKTVGLNVLLALSGVPIAAAEGSRVPFFSSVFADIGDEQSLEQSLSTFSSHLKHVIEILQEGDERSLILLDELGAGTDPLEGGALGQALLDTFLQRGWSAIITTHIGSLKEYAYLHEGAENAAMEFDPRSLEPTYRLLMGVPGSSNALAIARRMGLCDEVLALAEGEMARVEAPTREIISRMERSRRRVERERRRTERVRRKAQVEAQALEDRRAELEAERAAFQLEAELEVERATREARDRLLALLRRLANVPRSHQAAVQDLEAEVELLVARTPLGARREAFAISLRKDDEVYVPKFRARARVRKVDRSGRSLTVLLDGLPVQIGFDDVSWLEKD
jgi:DNA mismatch repair protein MutS2